MRRREFVAGLGSATVAWPSATRAQQPLKARIGWLTVAPHPFIAGFREGMRAHGWIENVNLMIDERYADGRSDRLPELAAALAGSHIDLIVASGSDAVAAASKATQSLPIVGISSDMGLGGSLARPQGNLTGLSLLYDEAAAKWPEFLAEVVPRVDRIGVVHDTSSSNQRQLEAVRTTAATLAKEILPLRIAEVDDIARALDRAREGNASALIFLSSPIFTANAPKIADLVLQSRRPAIFESRVLVQNGGLMSYGPNINDVFRRAASYADKLLRGSKVGDLPIERATKFGLAINLKAAREFDVIFPPTLLARADEVIE